MDFEELAFKLSIKDLADQDARVGRRPFAVEYLEETRGEPDLDSPLQSSVDTVHWSHRDFDPGLVEARPAAKATMLDGFHNTEMTGMQAKSCNRRQGSFERSDYSQLREERKPLGTVLNPPLCELSTSVDEDGLLDHELHRKL